MFKAVEDIPRGAPVGLFFEGEAGKARYDTVSGKNYLGIADRDIGRGEFFDFGVLVRSGVVYGVLDKQLGGEEVEAGDQLFIGEGKLSLKMPDVHLARVVLVGMALNKKDLLAYWQYVGQVSTEKK